MATEVKTEMPVHPGSVMMMSVPLSGPPQSAGSHNMSMHVGTPTQSASVMGTPTPHMKTHSLNQTPSPSTPTTSNHSSASKRPTRKSTLTQQQKNQKRQRATQDQLTTLEMEFNKNPTPNAETRLLIADQINMTERSVQIWFQNRYVHLLPTLWDLAAALC